MTRPIHLPPSQLDRLVDGELSPKETRDLIQVIEETPEGWKECALAFLEAQVWQQTLQALAASPQRPPVNCRGTTPERWRSAILAALTTLAALLLGVLLGSRLEPDSPNRHEAAVVSTSTGRAPHPASRSSARPNDEGPWQLVVDSPAGRAIVPVYSPTDRRLAQAWQEDSGLWWAALREAGAPIDERQRWYGVALENGRQVWLPIREVRWRGGNSGTLSAEVEERLRQLAPRWSDDPVARQLRHWLQEPPSGEALHVLRIGPGVLIEPDHGSFEDELLADRLDRLEQDLQDLQQRLRQALAKRRRAQTGQ